MKFSALIFAAVASASPALFERQLAAAPYPLVQVLPVPGLGSSSDTFNNLGAIYLYSAGNLTSAAVALAQKNVQLSGSGGIQYSYDVKASIASSLALINNLFWQTAVDAEQKVCSIVTSISQQNVNTVQGQLSAGITAEVRVIVGIATTLAQTVAAIKAQATAFTDAEKAVVAAAIQAIAAAATASISPATRLSAGLSATGVTTLGQLVQSLQAAIVSLQAAAEINWTTT